MPHGEQREFLEGIQRNGKALLELIGDILDLSRIEAEKLTLAKADCSLRQIVDDVLSMVQVRSEKKRLSLEVDYHYPLPERIHTDPRAPPPNTRELVGQRREVHGARRHFA